MDNTLLRRRVPLPVVAIVVVVVAVVCGCQGAAAARYRTRQVSSPVIAGKVVKPIDAGWQVAVIHKRRLNCGGSLLQDDVVLTAASCVKDLEPADMQVRAGTTNFKTGGQVRQIRETVHHPDYDEELLANNVALLHLLRPFNATVNQIRLVDLPEADQALPSTLMLYGWGVSAKRRGSNATMTKNLRGAKIKVYAKKRCAPFFDERRFLIEQSFCAGDRTKRVDICNDDVGGPALASDGSAVQWGLVSESSGCTGERHTTVFTQTQAHKAWIEQTLAEFGGAPPPEKPQTRWG